MEKPVVRVVKDTPPAELLRCPKAPAFDVSEGGNLPAAKRESLRALAKAYAEAAAQLRRLIAWNQPGACGTAPPK